MILAFHGPQGSGKTSLATSLQKHLEAQGENCLHTGIKETFQSLAQPAIQKMGLTIPKDIQAIKQLELAISTWGEVWVNPMVWSELYWEKVQANPHRIILTSDIRTPMNLDVLLRAAHNGRTVYLFALHAREEIRKTRVSTWRENGGYTENMLSRPAAHPNNFFWVDINTEGTLAESLQAVQIAGTIAEILRTNIVGQANEK